MNGEFYNDHLYKKLKPKAEVLENLLEITEQRLQKWNQVHSLVNVTLPLQEDSFICGRIFNDNTGGGKLTEHNVVLQGSYVCSNSHSISLNLANCPEYSLFSGQIVLVNGRNPNGKRFICKEIIEPKFVSENDGNFNAYIKEEPDSLNIHDLKNNSGISVRLEKNENLIIMAAAGPYMTNGSIDTKNLTLLTDVAKAKNAHLLILLGPFVDSNHDLISNSNLQYSYEELLQKILDEVADNLKNTGVQVLIQPSLNDITQEPIYPVHPITVSTQFLKQNSFFHFTHEPSTIKINNIEFAITSTDIIKDLTTSSVSKTQSSDRITRNFAHLLRQRSFYPIYPPPDHIPIDYEAWNKYARFDKPPRVFIAVSDLTTFVKDVNNCVCLNPGKLVKGVSTGSYAQIIVKQENNNITDKDQENKAQSNILVSFHKI